MYLKSFRIYGYKNLCSEVILEDLGPINVIHGDNNAGKSNLMEGIGLFFFLLDRAFGKVSPWHVSPLQENGNISRESLADMGLTPECIFNKRNPLSVEMTGVLGFSSNEARGLQEGELPQSLTVSFSLSPDTSGTDKLTYKMWNILLGSIPYSSHLDTELVMSVRKFGAYAARKEYAAHKTTSNFALIRANRSVSCEATSEFSRKKRGSKVISAYLRQRLYTARADLIDRRIWHSFTTMLNMFSDVLEAERYELVYNFYDKVIDFVVEKDGYRSLIESVGIGAQQIACLLGLAVTSHANILGIEEPELNLHFALQLRLNDCFARMSQHPEYPTQVFLLSHSPAFCGATHFYGMRRVDGAPKVKRLSNCNAAQFTGYQCDTRVSNNAPLCYVNEDGVVLIPPNVRKRLGIEHGGGVFFVDREDTGHTEMLSDEQWFNLLKENDSEE